MENVEQYVGRQNRNHDEKRPGRCSKNTCTLRTMIGMNACCVSAPLQEQYVDFHTFGVFFAESRGISRPLIIDGGDIVEHHISLR